MILNPQLSFPSAIETTSTSFPPRLRLSNAAVGRCSRRRRLRRRAVTRPHAVKGANDDDDEPDEDDEDEMIVLRIRMKELKKKLAGKREKSPAPAHWTEWEKKYFEHYNEDVCEAIGLLQLFLMNSRPSMALGMMAFLGLCLPISTYVFLLNAVDSASGILSRFQQFK